jgi:hypothetical protein
MTAMSKLLFDFTDPTNVVHADGMPNRAKVDQWLSH